MLDRYDALIAMQGIEVDLKRDFLITLFDKNNYNSIQTEIVSQLSKDSTAATMALFKKALHDKDFLVRRAVIDNIGNIPQELLADVEPLLTDTSYVTIETALRKLVRQYPANVERYLAQVKDVLGINNNVRIAYLELLLKQAASIDLNSAAVDELTDYTSNQYEFRTRIKALDAAERVGYANEKLFQNLLNASLYTNNRINGPASRTLKNLIAKSPENAKLANDAFIIGVWTEREKTILTKLLNK